MKRVRWNGELQWDDGEGGVLRSDPTGLLETDYRGFEWREVEGTEYVPETGEIRLVLKPVKKSFAEEMADFFREEWVGHWNNPECCPGCPAGKAIAAINRELANPAKPPESDGRIPQRLLDMIDPSAISGGTRAVLLVSDGGWAVKDFPSGVDIGRVELWCGPSVLESRCSHDRVKPKEAAQ